VSHDTTVKAWNLGEVAVGVGVSRSSTVATQTLVLGLVSSLTWQCIRSLVLLGATMISCVWRARLGVLAMKTSALSEELEDASDGLVVR
jgi:hypothetical protein